MYIQDTKLLFRAASSVVEIYSSLLTLRRLYSSPKISRRLYPTGFCTLIREKENNCNKKAAMAMTLSSFPPESAVSLATANTEMCTHINTGAHVAVCALKEEIFVKARKSQNS